MSPTRTFCRICEAVCGLEAVTGPDGAVRLLPDRAHPVSQGYACGKGLTFGEVARGPTRLRRPLKRGQPVSWEDAYAEVSRTVRPVLARHGPHAVGIYFGNPVAFNTLAAPAVFGLQRRLGTRNVFSAISQDCGNKFAGARLVHGSPAVHPLPDFEHCDLALLFGTNPFVSQGSFVHLGDGARVFDRLVARGAEVLWVDPLRHESARRWGTHVPVRPGGDVWLLLALLALLAPERPEDGPHVAGLVRLVGLARSVPLAEAARLSGLSVEALFALAAKLRAAKRVALHMSVGVNQGRFGTLCYVLLHALAYVTGNLDREGGSLFHPFARAAGQLARLAGVDARGQRSRVGGFGTVMDTLPGAILAEEMSREGEERIRVLICIGGSPAKSIPGSAAFERALNRLESLVCVDVFESALTARADVVLPATSWLERWDFASTALVLQTGSLLPMAGPVMAPLGEARSDARIVAELSVALGRPLLGAAAVTRFLASRPWDRWLGAVARAVGHGLPSPAPRPGRYLEKGTLHADGKLHLWDEALEPERARLQSAAAEPEPPLLLIGRRRRLGHNSWLHGPREAQVAWVSPEQLARLGLASGDRARLVCAEQSLEVTVESNDSVSLGTVVLPHGLTGPNVNALLPGGPAFAEPLSGQHWMTGIPVSIQPLSARS